MVMFFSTGPFGGGGRDGFGEADVSCGGFGDVGAPVKGFTGTQIGTARGPSYHSHAKKTTFECYD